jgi:hypothetical protein
MGEKLFGSGIDFESFKKLAKSYTYIFLEFRK